MTLAIAEPLVLQNSPSTLGPKTNVSAPSPSPRQTAVSTNVLPFLKLGIWADEASDQNLQDEDAPDWTEIEKALFDARIAFKVYVSQVSMHIGREWSEKLFKRIDRLLDPEEWDADDLYPRADSMKSFMRLLLKIRPERLPGLSLAGSGNYVAAWTTGTDRLTIECLGNDIFKWVLAKRQGAAEERAAGITGLDRIVDVLEPYNPQTWFSNGNDLR